MTDMSQARRNRRRQDMRNELADAAVQLFEARGFDDVTVDEIAAAVEVSQRTFFRYFDSKYEVLFADHDERLGELRALLAARPPDEPVLTAVRAALVGSTAHYQDGAGRTMLRRLAIIANSSTLTGYSMALQADWEDAITSSVLARLGDAPGATLRARVVGAASMAGLRIALASWRATDGDASYAELIDEVFGILDGGLNRAPSAAK